MTFNGLMDLQKELTDAVKDTSLPTGRRELALTLLDFLDTAPSSYVFAPGDYDSAIEELLRPVRACAEARARWHIPQEFTPHYPAPRVNTPPQEVAFEEIF
jgi:hypothetical protein